MMMNKIIFNRYLVYWFDNKLWRDKDFYLLAENETQVREWVMKNYEPRGGEPSIRIEMREAGLSFPLITNN